MTGKCAGDVHDEKNYDGFYYELAIELESRDESALCRAFDILWAGAVAGPMFRGIGIEVCPSQEIIGFARGVCSGPDGKRIACVYNHVWAPGESPSVAFGFPFGALTKLHGPQIAYPDEVLWRAPYDRILIEHAKRLLERVPFLRGEIGTESAATADFVSPIRPPGRRHNTQLTVNDQELIVHWADGLG